MVSCESKIIKLLLGVFNLVWLVLGGGVIYIGYRLVKWNKDFDGVSKLADINLQSISIVILGIGIVIALISFLGFFGACCENSFMLNAYGFLMVLMIGAQAYALYTAIKNNGNIQDDITNGIQKAIQNIKKEPQTAYYLELFQYTAHCCGWNGKKDYNTTTDSQLPGSCCGEKPQFQDKANPTCGTKPVTNSQPCVDVLHFNQIQNLFKGTIGVGVAVIMFELILIFAACCLAREVRYN